MRIRSLCLALIVLTVACGNHTAKSNTSPSAPILIPINGQIENVPDSVDSRDLLRIPNLRPTTYYVPEEKKVSCTGKYGGATYNGSEQSKVLNKEDQEIATVCTRFYKTLLMEGTAILTDRGHGETPINYAGKINGNAKFHVLERCTFGEGVERDLCLLPYHTLAADNKAHKVGDIIYIPKAKGLVLPDGSIHEGFFVVRDTGSAFNGIGAERVDMFTGTDPDNSNIFIKSGFDRNNPMSAFKIKGDSAKHIEQKLKEKFGDLY
jgi:3D (Asp-Asp-Asp) domain-containing protein